MRGWYLIRLEIASGTKALPRHFRQSGLRRKTTHAAEMGVMGEGETDAAAAFNVARQSERRMHEDTVACRQSSAGYL
jgi:hypothetical protein